ncbi:MAG: PhzF family phenazine biosynthesis protein [Cytophagaceae bacterium]
MIQYYHVDSFADQAFKGNPAAVFMLKKILMEEDMQRIAGEFNLPASTFVYHDINGYHIRWFAPKKEILLCGHGTLAAAHVLFEEGFFPKDKVIKFISASGTELNASYGSEGISITLPTIPVEHEVVLDNEIAKAFDSEVLFSGVHKNGYLLELASEDDVRNLNPDFFVLSKHTKVFIATAKAKGKPYDFVSRVFVPFAGINEDPVTGSAHACLACYWSEKLGKNNFTAYQASQRGGVMGVSLKDNLVELTSKAVIVSKGEFLWGG